VRGYSGVCAALLLVIDRSLTPVQSVQRVIRGEESPKGSWRLLRESTHLRAIAYILGLTIIVSTIVDWQLSKSVELFVPGEDAKTAFFGQFFVVLNVMSVIIQFLLTSWVLRVLGVGVGLLILPIGLMTGSIGQASWILRTLPFQQGFVHTVANPCVSAGSQPQRYCQSDRCRDLRALRTCIRRSGRSCDYHVGPKGLRGYQVAIMSRSRGKPVHDAQRTED
jgi:hypothetical protein